MVSSQTPRYVTYDEWQQGRSEDRAIVRETAEAVVAGAAAAQEQRYAAIRDEVRAVAEAVVDGMGKVEHRIDNVESSIQIVRRDIYGNPDERSGNPSIFERLEMAEERQEHRHHELMESLAGHDIRIAKYERYEALAIKTVRAAGDLAQIILKGRIALFVKGFIGLLFSALPWLSGIALLLITAIARFG